MIAATGDAIAQAFDDLRNLDATRVRTAAAAEIPRYRPQTGLNRLDRSLILTAPHGSPLETPDFSQIVDFGRNSAPSLGLYALLTMPDVEPAGAACSGCDKGPKDKILYNGFRA